MSIIYSELSELFKLSEVLNKIKDGELKENEVEKNRFIQDFINNIINLFSVTNKTEDEEFARIYFLKKNNNLFNWIKGQNFNLQKENYFENLISNLYKSNNNKNNDNNNFDNNKSDNKFKDEEKSNDISIDIMESINVKKKNNNQFNSINNMGISKNSDNNINNNKKNKENYINNKELYKNYFKDETNNINNKTIVKENKNETKNMGNYLIENDYQEGDEEENEEEEDNSNSYISENNKNKERKILNNEYKGNMNNNKEKNKIENYQNEKSDDSENGNYSFSDSKIGEIEYEIDNLLDCSIKEYINNIRENNNNNINNFNNLYVKINKIAQNMDLLNDKYKDKITTLICAIFPLCSIEQKKNLSKINLDNDLKIYLEQTLLYFDGENEDYKNFTNLLSDIPKAKKSKKQLDVNRNLSLNSKNEIFILYQFLIIYKIFGSKNGNKKNSFDDGFYLKDFYFISFKIYFLLVHQEYFTAISDNFLDIYEKLLFMKEFYSKVITNKLDNKLFLITKNMQNKKKENICKRYEFNKYILGEEKCLIIEKLFEKDEIELNEEVIKIIKYFYKIDEDKGLELLNYSSNRDLDERKYNFVTNIVELVYNKKIFFPNKFDKIKKNLLNIEKFIQQITKQIFVNKAKYKMNNDIKKIFDDLTNEIKNEIKRKYENREMVNFYAIGSFTEFLFFNDEKYKLKDNLNICLDIYKLSILNRKKVLWSITHYLKDKYSAKMNLNKNTKNLTFDFQCNNINFNLIVLGEVPYIHSLLFRAYSIMDSRFPIIGLTLKYFLKKIDGANDHKTFAFMNLLVAFLQDIIQPPVLPKIFSAPNSKIYMHRIPFSKNLFENKIDKFIDNLDYKGIHLPKHLFKKEELKDIYEKQIGNNKNKLKCSQIFLYFLEFLIYYFKFDSIYINSSLDYEGFYSMNDLLNEDIEDEDKYPNDRYFKEFYKNNYYKKKDKMKGLILIRDPINPFYNPGYIFYKSKFENLYNKIKKGYEILVNTGNFKELENLNENK